MADAQLAFNGEDTGMGRIFESIAAVVTRRPGVSLSILAVVTVILAAGTSLSVPQAGNEVFLPADSEVNAASETLSENFSEGNQTDAEVGATAHALG